MFKLISHILSQITALSSQMSYRSSLELFLYLVPQDEGVNNGENMYAEHAYSRPPLLSLKQVHEELCTDNIQSFII
jgi:hypothetical protein